METKGTPTPQQEQFATAEVVESTVEPTPAPQATIVAAEPKEAIIEEPQIVEIVESTVEPTLAPQATIVAAEPKEAIIEEPKIVEMVESTSDIIDPVAEEEAERAQNEFAAKSKVELVDLLATMIQERPVHLLKNAIDQLKIAFYKKHNAEIEVASAEFKEANPETEFVAAEDAQELRLKELINLYRTKRDQFLATAEAEKEKNYKLKLQIIDELKELTSSSETLGNTFNAFRELQKRWKEIGLVPQLQVRDLWETYNHHVETFYNYIKINKELRDLDLKKNHEAKLILCQQADALMLEPSAVGAFHKLQKLHTAWRETGPVSEEFKEQLWERFKQASAHVNKRHQEHFDALRDEQITNLKLKEELCLKIEALSIEQFVARKAWDDASEQIIEIQKLWKTIGFAPRKDNNHIYERFRGACDKFFAAKREYFDGMKSEFTDNYQAKLDLCVQAEAMCENTDFKQTTEDILELQKRWKTIGPTSRKHSDAVWKRFREACDKFFASKSKHFELNDAQYAQNLEAKQQIITELQAVDFASANFDVLKDFQRRWSAIGYVPIKQKESLTKLYKELTDKLYDTLRSGEGARRVENYKSRVSSFKDSGRVQTERDKMVSKMRTLENEIQTLENNIGFFGNSKNAEALVRDVRAKIDRAKAEIIEIIEKVKIIDNQQ